jgi:putative flippase GtrA
MIVPIATWSASERAFLDPLRGYARAHASQLVRFVAIGGSVAALNLAVLYILRTWLSVSGPIALTIMYVIGVLAHFPSNRRITYRAQGQPLGPQIVRYAAMLLWNFAVMQTVVALGAHASISSYIAVMGSTGLTMVLNFLYMTHVVFVKGRRQ